MIPKRLRIHSALLRVLRSMSQGEVAVSLSWISIRLMQKLDDRVFSGDGHPHHPLEGVYKVLCIMAVKMVGSRNKIVEMVSASRMLERAFKLYRGKKARDIFHGSVLTRFDERVTAEGAQQVIDELAGDAIRRGIITGRIIVLDSYPVNLCEACKRSGSCPYLQGKNEFPKDCLMHEYEWAAPVHKSAGERFVGGKIHTAMDLDSGLAFTALATKGNVHDSQVAIDLLKKVKQLGLHPEVIIMDGAYNDTEIHRYAIKELKVKVVSQFNPRNEKRETITFQCKDGRIMTTTTRGTPICKAGKKMKYVPEESTLERNVWRCQRKCRKRKRKCVAYTYPEDDYRRFSNPPYETEEYERLYRLRKLGEQPYSQLEQNLSVPLTVKDFEGFKVHAYVSVAVLLMLAILADDLGLPKYIAERNIRSLGHYIKTLLLGGFKCPYTQVRCAFIEVEYLPEIVVLEKFR